MLDSRLSEVFARYSDAPAVEELGRVVTYGELMARTSDLATQIDTVTNGRRCVVATNLPRGLDYVVVLLAVWRRGHVLVPLDPAWPSLRREDVLRQTRPDLLLQGIEAPAVPGFVGTGKAAASLRLSVQDDEAERLDRSLLDGVDYIVFTSGSTGRPKGIRGRLSGLLPIIDWELQALGADTAWRATQIAPPTFDASFREILLPLLSGGAILIPPEDTKQNPAALIDWIAARRPNLLHFVPSFLGLLLEELPEQGRAEALVGVRAVLMAGESFEARDAARLMARLPPGAAVYNLYGASETTMFACAHRVDTHDLERDGALPLGTAIAGGAVRLAPITEGAGQSGEILIETSNAAAGYLEPDRDADRWSRIAGRTVYRTGDIGEIRGGLLYHVGRLDDQIKIAGNRVHPRELETAVMLHPGVSQAAAVARIGEGGASLALFLATGAAIDPAELRQLWETRLPPCFWPSLVRQLPALPRNANGKIDRAELGRRAATEPPLSGAGNRAAQRRSDGPVPDLPVPDLEERLIDLFVTLYSAPSPSRQTSFFDVAGTSLQAMRLVAAVYRTFSRKITVRDVFDCPTVGELADLLRRPAAIPAIAAPVPGQAENAFPLSPYQSSMWLASQHRPAEQAYTEHTSFVVEGDFSVSTCQAVLRALHHDFDILRTRYVIVEGEPRQTVHPAESAPPAMEVIDLSAKICPEADLRARLDREISRPWALADEAPYRVFIHKLAAEKHVVSVIWFHILGDMRTVHLISAEAGRRYLGFARTCPSLSYGSVAIEQEDEVRRCEAEDSAYWRRMLAQEPAPIEWGGRRPVFRTFRGRSFQIHIGAAATNYYRSLARSNSTSLFMVGLTAFGRAVHAHLGRADLMVGFPVTLRDRPDLHDLAGYMVNAVPLHLQRLDEDFAASIAAAKQAFREGAAHHRLPFERLRRLASTPTPLSRSPLYDLEFTMVSQEESHLLTFDRDGIVVRPFQHFPPTAKYDLNFIMVDCGDWIEGRVEWCPDVMEEGDARAIADRLAAPETGMERSRAPMLKA